MFVRLSCTSNLVCLSANVIFSKYAYAKSMHFDAYIDASVATVEPARVSLAP